MARQFLTGVTGTSATLAPNSASSLIGLTVKANAGGGGGVLTSWQSSAGSQLSYVDSAGAFTISPSSGTALTVNGVASGIGLQINPNASGGDTARFYHTNGSLYSGFDNAGRLFVRTGATSLGAPAFGVLTANDTAVGAIIRGNSATQSANLQQWQDSSANVITRVVAGGGIIAVEPIVSATAGAGTTTTLDCSTGTTFTLTFGAGNITGLLFTNLPNAGSTTITLVLKQDATGSRTITWSGTQVNGSATNATPKWAGGAPTLTTTANAVDIITLVINRTAGATDSVYGFLAGKAFT